MELTKPIKDMTLDEVDEWAAELMNRVEEGRTQPYPPGYMEQLEQEDIKTARKLGIPAEKR